MMEPCGDEAVKRAMQPLVLVFGVSDSARTSAFWKVYLQALRDLPVAALEQAVQDYASSPESLFFPKPGQLKALALKRAEPIYQAASRAKSAADGPAIKAKVPVSDAYTEALRRAQELEREVPMKVRMSLPFSQWPAEYRAKLEEANRLRERAR
jgi:hypothetical protein